MTESKTRIRWTRDEKQLLAAEMVRLLEEAPRQSKLQAVMKAQQVLSPPRQRAVAAWATVREQLEPFMKEAAAAAARSAQATVTSPEENQAPSGDQSDAETALVDQTRAVPPAMPTAAAAPAATLPEQPMPTSNGSSLDSRLGGLFAQQFESLSQLGAQALERMVLQALSSPAVAERLGALLREALAAQAGATGSGVAPEPVARTAAPLAMPRPKVLVAGLEPAQANELAEAFSDSLDLRNWRPGETKEQLRSLARVCTVAVLLAEALDHDTETTLKAMHLRIVKHSGGFARLKDRLHELVDSGMFNVLT